MTEGDHGHDPSHAAGDGEHAPDRVADSERGHDYHATEGDSARHDDGDANARAHSNASTHKSVDHHAADATNVGAAVVTVSSSRSLDDDPSGDAIASSLADAGHEIATRELINDEFDGIQSTVLRLTKRDDVDVVVTTGGTGVTPDDVTPDAVEPLFDRHLPGFGEEFRQCSIDEIGPMGMISRATAGVAHGTLVASLPGSESAARTGVSLVESIVGHVVALAASDDESDVDE